MTNIRRISSVCVFSGTVLLLCIIFGCNNPFSPQTTQGNALQITGPANIPVVWNAVNVEENDPGESSCCPTCSNSGSVPLDATGHATVTQVLDGNGTSYEVMAVDGSCMGTTPQGQGCQNPDVSLFCAPVPPTSAQGTISVGGANTCKTENVRQRVDDGGQIVWVTEPETVCNGGTVSVIIDGQTVSAGYGQGSTPSQVAFGLATAIDSNSVLDSQIIAVATGAVVHFKALNTGSQYAFPWQTSCTYSHTYFTACDFQANPSPQASMTIPQ